MTTRDVQIRLRSTGFDDLIAKFDEFTKKIDDILLKIDELDLKLDRLSAKNASPDVELKGVDDSLAKVALLDTALDSLGRKNVKAGIGTSGGGSSSSALKDFEYLFRSKSDGSSFKQSDIAKLRTELGNNSGKTRVLSSIAGLLFGGGGGGGASGAAGAAEEAGGEGSFTAAEGITRMQPYAIGGLVAAALSILPAVMPLAIGGLVGGGGIFGAYELGSSAHTKLQTLQTSYASATGTNKTKIAQEIVEFKKKNATALSAYSSFSGVGHAAESTFTGALTSGGKDSFLSGIAGDMKQLGGFVKTLGPMLSQMFQASLPFVKMFVTVLEQAAKIIMPAFTQSMKEFRPYLPIVEQGFKMLAQGVADLIKDLGPGMKDGAIVFKAMMDMVKGLLIAVAGIADALAFVFERMGKNMGHAGLVIGHAFMEVVHWAENMYHDLMNLWHRLPGDLEQVGKDAVMGLVHGFESMFGAISGVVGHIASMIPHGIMSLLHMASPSKVMFDIGGNIGEGLAQGIDSKHGRVMSSAANLAKGIPGSVGSTAAGAGLRSALPIDITLRLNDDLMQVISRNIRVAGGDPRILIRKVQIV